MSTGLPALTIRQPWASAVALGLKDVENRGWATAYRGPLLIHAAARSQRGWRDSPRAPLIGQIRPASLWRNVHGLIIGVAELVDVITGSTSPWADPEARFHWLLDDAAVFDDPMPATGRLGLWIPGGEVWAA